MLEEWAKSNCLLMFLDGTGGPFSSDPVLRRCGWGVAVLDFADVFAPSLVFGRGGGLPGRQTHCPQVRDVRQDPGAPLRTAQDPLWC